MKQYYFLFVFVLVVAIAGSGISGAAVADLNVCPSDVDTQLLDIYNDLLNDYDVEKGDFRTMKRDYRLLMLYFNDNIECFCENKEYWRSMILIEHGKSDFYLTFVGSLNNIFQQCPRDTVQRSLYEEPSSDEPSSDEPSTDDFLNGDREIISGGNEFDNPFGDTQQFEGDLNFRDIPTDFTASVIQPRDLPDPDCTDDDQCEMVFAGYCTLEVSAFDLCETQCPVPCVPSNDGYSCPQ